MAVAAEQAVEYRRFNGYLDTRYPEGYWYGVVSVTGNVTGGTQVCILAFGENPPAFRNSRIYNLEQFSVLGTPNTVRGVVLNARNFDGPSNAGMLRNYMINRQSAGGSPNSATEGEGYNFLPLFLGSQGDLADVQALQATMTNVDGDETTFEAEGYWWGPRSVLADGGPQRPPTRLYGH